MMEKDDSKSSKDVPALHKDNPKYLLTFVRQTISGFLEKGSPTHAHEKKQMKSGLVSLQFAQTTHMAQRRTRVQDCFGSYRC